MARASKWILVVTLSGLAITGLLVVRAGLRPCGWFDTLLKRRRTHTVRGCLCTLVTQQRPVAGVDVSPDGNLVAVSTDHGKVTLWRLADGKHLRTLRVPHVATSAAHSYDVVFSPDGKLLALGQPDGSIALWQMPDGTRIGALARPGDHILSLAFSPDGQLLASGAASGRIRIWRLADQTAIRDLDEHSGGVMALAFSPQGSALAAASLDSTITLWDVDDGTRLAVAASLPIATGVAFSPDGSVLAAGRRLWRLPDLQPAWDMGDAKGGMGNVTFSPDGTLLAAGNAWYEVGWWRASDGKLLRRVTGHRDSVNSVAFTPDGEVLVSGSLDGTVRLWHVPGDS